MVAARTGWQTTLADLALILFMVTAAAIAEAPDDIEDAAKAQDAETTAISTPVPASGQPLAIYRAAPNAPALGEWLAWQSPDERQHLTIVARYAPGGEQNATRDALAWHDAALAAGHSARIVLEPAAYGDLIAVLDFDGRQTGTPVARDAASSTDAATAAQER